MCVCVYECVSVYLLDHTCGDINVCGTFAVGTFYIVEVPTILTIDSECGPHKSCSCHVFV